MARKGSNTDFPVDVDGLGTFIFAKRAMADEIKIQVEYSRMLEGATPTDWLALVAGWLATLRVLTVQAPDGWDLDSLDPLEDDTYTKLGRVNQALADKERSFRGKPSANSEA